MTILYQILNQFKLRKSKTALPHRRGVDEVALRWYTFVLGIRRNLSPWSFFSVYLLNPTPKKKIFTHIASEALLWLAFILEWSELNKW